jgi:3-isopropylmalate dehydratase small subunit
VAGEITTADSIPDNPSVFMPDPEAARAKVTAEGAAGANGGRPTVVKGRVWMVEKDNIDTDMIFHNRHLAITDIAEMGQHTFGNLPGWENFPAEAVAGDIVVVGSNFGCGSSRQQAVDCFASLGVSLLIAESFGAIYERNAINAGMPIMAATLKDSGIATGDEIEVDLASGKITHVSSGRVFEGRPFSEVQMEIYQRGGLLAAA